MRNYFNVFTQILVKDTQIEVVETFKYLGILLGNRLRFSTHLLSCILQGYEL